MGNISNNQFYALLRRAWLERRAQALGALRREHLVKAFGITPQQATADIQAYLAEAPGRLRYDGPAKQYVWLGKKLALKLPWPVKEAAFTDNADWDRQIESDGAAGKLDFLAAETAEAAPISNKEFQRRKLDARLDKGLISPEEWQRQMGRTFSRGGGKNHNAGALRRKIKRAAALLAEGAIDQAEHDRRVTEYQARLKELEDGKANG